MKAKRKTEEPDTGNLVVLTNCFAKKTQKTPKKELELAIKLKKEFLIEKYGRTGQ